MSARVGVVLLAVLVLAATCQAAPTINISVPLACPSRWTYFEETASCYKTGINATFDEAEKRCQDIGGHLASVHSEVENEFLISLVEMGWTITGKWGSMTWIGLNSTGAKEISGKMEYDWKWTDGTPVDFLKFAPRQPLLYHELCVQLIADVLTWDDMWKDQYRHWNNVECSAAMRSFICKKKAERLEVRVA